MQKGILEQRGINLFSLKSCRSKLPSFSVNRSSSIPLNIHLNNLRFFSNLYFHGHSVGGTNPSLLEAMASQALIAAHNNDFNKGVLKENAFYFSNASEVQTLLKTINKRNHLHFIKNNYDAIVKDFN